MGNCLIICHKKNNKIASLSPHDDYDNSSFDHQLLETARKAVENNKEELEKKKTVRIRVLVTKQELRDILNGEGSDSTTGSKSGLEELVMRKVKLKEYREMFNSENDDVVAAGWRPALESIPEDH
ncbi:hypothetical protein LINPERPRIM_LOCUS1839 [Linum perenne]